MSFFSKFKTLFTSENDVPKKEQENEIIHESNEIQEDISSLDEEIASETEDVADVADDKALILALRESEQKLSSWLNIVLKDVTKKGELLDKRIAFLLNALLLSEDDAKKFIADFNQWLEKMDYSQLEDFRSELQYRLSLALDLEDEDDERNRLILKLNKSLTKTREQFLTGVHALFSSHTALDANFWDELEELFIMSDMGYESAVKLVEMLKTTAATKNISQPSELLPHFADEIANLFTVQKRIEQVILPEVILFVGVNGVGKTTTIAKLAHRSKLQGKKVLIVAADTFRAAAIEQLNVWADRIGVDFYSKSHGADPAAVAYEAMDMALEKGYDTIYIDTAGRLHTKSGLMDELGKIRSVISKKHASAPHRTVLVIDATTGQNAIQQTKLFTETAHVSEIILTKLDGTAKGGIAIAIASLFKTPITFVGLGEKLADLRPFNPEDYAKALFDIKTHEESEE